MSSLADNVARMELERLRLKREREAQLWNGVPSRRRERMLEEAMNRTLDEWGA